MDRRVLITTGLATGALTVAGGARATPAIGRPAPKFSLTTFDHRHVRLADLAGKVVVLNYWAVWCGPCKAELPMIDAYVRKRGGDDLKVFAVTVDDTVSDDQLKPLASVLSFPLVTRIDSFSYGTIDGAVPTNYVIGRDGTCAMPRPCRSPMTAFPPRSGPCWPRPRRRPCRATTLKADKSGKRTSNAPGEPCAR